MLELQTIPEDEKRSPDHKKSKKEKKEEKKREKKEKKKEKHAKRDEEAKYWRSQIANTPHKPRTDSAEGTTSPPRRDTHQHIQQCQILHLTQQGSNAY